MAQTLTKGRFYKFSLVYSINRCFFLLPLTRTNSDFSAKIIYIPYLKETKKSELITFFQKIDLFLLSKTST